MSVTSIPKPFPPSTASGEPFASIPTRIQNDATEAASSQEIPEVIERLHVLEQQLAQIHRVCSEAYCSQGRYVDAQGHQEVAARFDSTNLEYRNQLGFLRYINGDDGASEDFETILRSDPRNAEAWFNLGMLRFGLSQFGEAELAFTHAADIQQDDPEIWNNLGVARFHNGRAAEARQCFQRALQIDPQNTDAKQNLADLPA